jgi:phenylalanyl-tRNA synthetase beta chain
LAKTYDLSPSTDTLSGEIKTDACKRHINARIKGVKVGPSPAWLRDKLEAVGQRSINNIVDSTNYVMFHIGQPLHVFDAKKLSHKGDTHVATVRNARDGETITTLDGKDYTLNSSMLVIVDADDTILDIAGVKGGKKAELDAHTTDIVLEAANFDGPTIRKVAQQLRFRTDASQRFEQVISPELAAYGMQMLVDVILEVAGGTLVGYADVYPEPQQPKKVSVTASLINRVLGTELSTSEIGDVFSRLGFSYEENDGVFDIAVPFERLDLEIPEDLAEEVVRIVGYEAIGAEDLPPIVAPAAINQNYAHAERIREYLASQGFSEILTSTFAEKGERVVLNKVDGVKPYLRAELSANLSEALDKNVRNKDLLGLSQVKLFEIGSVWKGGGEKIMLGLAVEQKKKTKNASEYLVDLAAHLGETLDGALQPAHVLEIEIDTLMRAMPPAEHYEVLPSVEDAKFKPFSKYPFITRDIAMWTPTGTHADDIFTIIHAHAGDLLVRADLFDRFEKEGRISYAFRLVFQSYDRTLLDEDANHRMEAVTAALKEKGFEVR